MGVKIQLRRDTESNWSTINPILYKGEPGFETDTGKLKFGDGTSYWNDLSYFADGASLTLEQVEDSLGTSFLVAGSGIGLSYDDLGNTLTISSSGVGGTGTSITTIDLHNGGVQNAEVFQFTDKNYQSVITGPTPDIDNSAQRIIVQGQKGQGTGEGGDVYVWGGDADNNGGDIKIYAGDADNGSSGNGGYINITAGYGFDSGGNLELEAGNANVNGGNVDIRGGGGSSPGFVRITSGGIYAWVFGSDGDLTVPGSLLFNDSTVQTTAYTGIPVQDIISGTGISVSSSSGIYTISSSLTSVDEADSLVTNVFNKTGSPIPKFTVVYINGGQGDQPTIALAVASGEATSSKTYGITAEAISDMSTGKVIVEGALTGLNTDQFNPTAPTGDVNGTVIYLSPTTPGGVTTTKPSAPNHLVAVGTIVRTHQNEGVVEVRIQNGFELQELHNVAINGVTGGQFLQYNSGSGLWVPTSSGNFSTLQVNGTGVSISGHTHTSSNITDFTESVQDVVGASGFLIGQSGINITYSDASNTLTITNSSSGTTVANSGDNRILTSTGTSTGINAEANMTFNGTSLVVSGNAKFTQVYPTVSDIGTTSGSVASDVSTGQIFDITVNGSTTLSNPTNSIDGVTVRWRITQGGSGSNAISLDTKFNIPSSASSPLPWSTGVGVTDILAATYDSGRDKWDIVAFVPGY